MEFDDNIEVGVVVADVIDSTKLSREAYVELHDYIKTGLDKLKDYRFGNDIYYNLIKGDCIECACLNPEHAFEVAIFLKTYIRTFRPTYADYTFEPINIRYAISIDNLRIFDLKRNLIEGPAITAAAREVDRKEKGCTILYPSLGVDYMLSTFRLLADSIDTLLNATPPSQCHAIQTWISTGSVQGDPHKIAFRLCNLGIDAFRDLWKYGNEDVSGI